MPVSDDREVQQHGVLIERCRIHGDHHFAALGEFEGVAHQVGEHLRQPAGIADEAVGRLRADVQASSRPRYFSQRQAAIEFSGQGKVPIIRDGDRVVFDSWSIAVYLERTFPNAPSLFGGPVGGKSVAVFQSLGGPGTDPGVRSISDAGCSGLRRCHRCGPSSRADGSDLQEKA